MNSRSNACLAILLVSCATAQPAANVPPFQGAETRDWLVQESEPVARDDLLPAFEASARSYGCSTEHLGSESTQNIYGESRSYYGVSASCQEGIIALVTLAGGRVRIGCAKPTTTKACELLLRNISEARD
jgi:hypothetical protein